MKSLIFFKKVVSISHKSNKVIYENQSKISLIKNKLLKLIGIKFIELKQKDLILNKRKIKKINAFIKKKNISKILNLELSLIEPYYNDTFEKYKCLKNFFKQSKPKYTISNVAVGFMGAILDAAKANKSKIINIPHGTLSPSYNKYDKIYKNIISEGVFYDHSDQVVSQSKITNEFLKSRKFSGTILNGNIILGSLKKNYKQNNQILYAVTNKSFHNQQLIGVENFYEFYDNLNIFNSDNFFRKFKMKIQLHPSICHLKKLLEKKFSNLIFEDSNLEKNISNSSMVISFSSTVIEDALISNTPVILFDRHKRYRHFKTKNNKNLDILNYVIDKNKLKKIIKKVCISKTQNFDGINFDNSIKKNVSNLISILKN